MVGLKSPHIQFRRLWEILDTIRRDSVKAVNAPSQKQTYGVTARQGSVVSQLKLMLEETPEGVSLKSLARRMQMTIPATLLLVETMVTKGFMVREPNPTDRRAVCIKLTDKGMNLFTDVYAQFHDEVTRRAQALTPDELIALSSIVEKMDK